MAFDYESISARVDPRRDSSKSRANESSDEQTSSKGGRKEDSHSPKLIVGIGASAGGVEALVSLLKSIEPGSRCAFVIVQHMSPDFKTMLPDILSRQTEHQVVLVENGMPVRSGEFYLIPPDKMLTIYHGRLILESRDDSIANSFFPIDHFFKSLARDVGAKAVGVVLSGTGSDGADGVRSLREHGGYVIVQCPETAKFTGMPLNAIATDVANVIAPVSEISRYIEDFALGIRAFAQSIEVAKSENHIPDLDKVFLALRNRKGIDFSCYHDDLVSRRMDRRAKIAGCRYMEEYYSLLLSNKNELDALYNDLLLGVTEFNRHKESFQMLYEVAFPKMVEFAKNRDSIRIWVVGCSTGEEAFTLAFWLSDYLTEHKLSAGFKIFATDVDDRALRIASRAIYSSETIMALPESWQRKYFRIQDGQAHVVTRIRESIVFANHNVIKDAPFPDIDLISCRNLFIYLKRAAKERIIWSFQFSLREDGYLLLGPNEGVPSGGIGFDKLDSNVRLFQCKNPRRSYTSTRSDTVNPASIRSENFLNIIQAKKSAEEQLAEAIQKKIANEYSSACLVYNEDMCVEFYYGNVRSFCQPLSGRASHQLCDVLSDELFIAVESLRQRLTPKDLRVSETVVLPDDSDGVKLLDIQCEDIKLRKDEKSLYLVRFELRNQAKISSKDLKEFIPDALKMRLRQLESELKSSRIRESEVRREMAVIVGQLESSNENLRTANEELQAGSEELQSTNEELQAVNEELYTVNAECQLRITELSEMSSDVQNIYEVSEIGTLFVDKDLRIRKFNAFSQRIFRLIPDDVGRPLEHFSSSLKVDFQSEVASVLKTSKMYQQEITSADGSIYLMRIAPYRTDDMQIKGVVLVFIDVTSLKEVEANLTSVKDELDLLTKESSDMIVHFDEKANIISFNDSFRDFFGERCSVGASLVDCLCETTFSGDRADISNDISACFEGQLAESSFSYRHRSPTDEICSVSWHLKRSRDSGGSVQEFVAIGRLTK